MQMNGQIHTPATLLPGNHPPYTLGSTGWTTEKSEFESRLGQEFSLLHVVQTGSGVHPTSYSMGSGGFFPGGKAAGAWG
jgi:hypothetical protein